MVRHWRRGGKSGRRGKERRLKCVLEHADCLMLLQGGRLRVTGSRLFSWFPSSSCSTPFLSCSFIPCNVVVEVRIARDHHRSTQYELEHATVVFRCRSCCL